MFPDQIVTIPTEIQKERQKYKPQRPTSPAPVAVVKVESGNQFVRPPGPRRPSLSGRLNMNDDSKSSAIESKEEYEEWADVTYSAEVVTMLNKQDPSDIDSDHMFTLLKHTKSVEMRCVRTGTAPIHIATLKNNLEMLRYLVETRRCDTEVNAYCRTGVTPPPSIPIHRPCHTY